MFVFHFVSFSLQEIELDGIFLSSVIPKESANICVKAILFLKKLKLIKTTTS